MSLFNFLYQIKLGEYISHGTIFPTTCTLYMYLQSSPDIITSYQASHELSPCPAPSFTPQDIPPWGRASRQDPRVLCICAPHIWFKPLSTRPHQDVVWYNNSIRFCKILNYVPKEREKYTAKKWALICYSLRWLIGIILGKIICESSNWQHTKIEDH